MSLASQLSNIISPVCWPASQAQLLSTFKGDSDLMNREPRDRNLVLVLCYGAIFLNISATISSFILTDNLGELDYNAAKDWDKIPKVSDMLGNEATILKQYGASASWKTYALPLYVS